MITPDRIEYSPNFRLGTPTGRGVVIHATRSGVAGNPSELAGTINWFRNPNNPDRSSSHWLVGRLGQKIRIVNDDCFAQHAGEHNVTHWGIELEQATENEGVTAPQIAALVEVCRGYVEDFGVPARRVLNVGLPGFIGHQDTRQGRASGKSDPGRLFPWSAFIDALNRPGRDTTLDFVPGRDGLVRVGTYLVLYNNGLPIERFGGITPGVIAKRFGDQWVFLRNDGRGGAYWSEEEGD